MKWGKFVAAGLSLALGFAATAGIPVLAAAADCHGHWAEKQVDSFVEKGYTALHGDSTFKPDESITQGEFIDEVNKAFALAGASALKAGNTYGTVTRAEAAGIISGLLKPDVQGDAAALNKFKDAAEIPEAYKGALGVFLARKLIAGYTDGTLRPLKAISRAEAVTLLYRSLQSGLAEAGTYEGYLIDRHCFDKGDPEKESKMCLQMKMCAESGYGLAIKQPDGKFVFYPFDGNGQKLSEDLLKKSENEGAFKLSVEGKPGIDGIKVSAIREK